MIFIFFLELTFLFILSRFLTKELSLLFYKISRSKRISGWLLAVIFLPGTIIHELSHAIIAKLLLVHVGKMELMPEVHDDSLKLGSVQVGKVDFIRNFFIGVAPFFVGTALILLIIFYSFSKNLIGLNIITAIVVYILFVISNTMYSSKKDMEGAIEFFLFALLIIGLLFFAGVRFSNLSFFGSILNLSLIQKGIFFLFIPIGLDAVVIAIAKLLNRKD